MSALSPSPDHQDMARQLLREGRHISSELLEGFLGEAALVLEGTGGCPHLCILARWPSSIFIRRYLQECLVLPSALAEECMKTFSLCKARMPDRGIFRTFTAVDSWKSNGAEGTLSQIKRGAKTLLLGAGLGDEDWCHAVRHYGERRLRQQLHSLGWPEGKLLPFGCHAWAKVVQQPSDHDELDFCGELRETHQNLMHFKI